MSGQALANAAADLVGIRFRLGGRDPATGLDCIGLFAEAMRRIGRPVAVPSGYALRVSEPGRWIPPLPSVQLGPACGAARPGDVVLIRPSAGQLHLAIRGPDQSWVHAHASLRRVVSAPARPDGTVLHHWRLLSETESIT